MGSPGTDGISASGAVLLCPGVRISSISPGNTETEFAAHHLGDEKAAREFYSRIRNLQPGDIADAIVYLLSTPLHVQVHDIVVRPTEQEY